MNGFRTVVLQKPSFPIVTHCKLGEKEVYRYPYNFYDREIVSQFLHSVNKIASVIHHYQYLMQQKDYNSPENDMFLLGCGNDAQCEALDPAHSHFDQSTSFTSDQLFVISCHYKHNQLDLPLIHPLNEQM